MDNLEYIKHKLPKDIIHEIKHYFPTLSEMLYDVIKQIFPEKNNHVHIKKMIDKSCDDFTKNPYDNTTYLKLVGKVFLNLIFSNKNLSY